jgi:hypothetical protein
MRSIRAIWAWSSTRPFYYCRRDGREATRARAGGVGPIVADAARAIRRPFATRIARLVARRLAHHRDARQNGRRSIGAAGGPARIDVLQ